MATSVLGRSGARRTVPVRDLAAKLRVTAALLGCASQKDLCARFHEVNPGTTFDLDRSYKWMQGRAQPRSARVYQEWATLLGTSSPISHLQSCTIEEFLDLVCDRHQVSRDALAARAGIVVGAPAEPIELDPIDPLPGRHLVGGYACYSHALSPYFDGKIIRSSLVIEAAGVPQTLLATYAETVALGRVEVRGSVTVAARSVHIDLADPVEFRLAMCLFLPGTMASVLAGASWLDHDPRPAATRIVMIRIPGATTAALEASNRYLDATEPIAGDLAALGVPAGTSAGLDALLEGCLRGDHARDHIKVDVGEYSHLTLAIDRLKLQNEAPRAPLVCPEAAAPARRRALPSPDRDGRMSACLAPTGTRSWRACTNRWPKR